MWGSIPAIGADVGMGLGVRMRGIRSDGRDFRFGMIRYDRSEFDRLISTPRTSNTLEARLGTANSFAVINALLQVVIVVVTALTAVGAQTCDGGMLTPLTKSPVSKDDKSEQDSDIWVDCDTAPVPKTWEQLQTHWQDRGNQQICAFSQ